MDELLQTLEIGQNEENKKKFKPQLKYHADIL
jgi:hypothetical protein